MKTPNEYIKVKKKRFIMDVLDDFHREIKRRAAIRGITMTEWVILAIQERIQEEKKRE